ncbi:MAG: hypothetical protein K8S56_08465 [Candidatus Cloacimonetes bacterium]|nr:hypothetical protein [Candidatus Cloacimonadota bacterium]
MKRFEFNLINWILLVAGLLMLVVGYAIMGTGDNTISVILLTISYIVVLPASILAGFLKKEREEDKK